VNASAGEHCVDGNTVETKMYCMSVNVNV